jgi:hypothetical protein
MAQLSATLEDVVMLSQFALDFAGTAQVRIAYFWQQ